jgi:hypothetical protein
MASLPVLLVASLALQPLSAQFVDPAALIAFEYHGGLAQGVNAPGPSHGNHGTLGLSLPFPVNGQWAIRPRFEATFLGTTSTEYAQTSADVSTKQYFYGAEALYHVRPYRWTGRGVSPYVGAGLGLVKTCQERTLNGWLVDSGLPEPRSEWSQSLGISLLAGCNLHPSVALEARFQGSMHHFEGETIQDRVFSLSLHVWPEKWFS